MTSKTLITIETKINAGIEKVWECWTRPEHITQWNFASDDWCCPWSKNDLRVGGKFTTRMEAKDGSMGFDFPGEYTRIEAFKVIEYSIADGRLVTTHFRESEQGILVTESFEAENTNPIEMQKAGWQSILNNFKKHVESL